MRRTSVARFVLAALLAFTGACESPVENEPAPAISLSIVSGSGQTGAVGTELSVPLVVRVTTQQNKKTVGVPDQLVNFRIVTGAGSVFAGSALTDRDGMAQDYWTLGPEIGENVMEVRAVDPTTGEKLVFATFNAFGVIPGPEVCNGLDDNLDGTPDDASWVYCLGGAPAPNTDGRNSCSVDYLDLNANVADGCERLAGGRWTLAPAPSLTCDLPLFGSTTLRLTGFEVEVTSSSQLSVKPSFDVDNVLGDLVEGFVAQNLSTIPVPVVPVSETFGGSLAVHFFNVQELPFDADFVGDLAISLSGTFTGSSSFEATLDMALGLIVGVTIAGVDVREDVDCGDVNVTSTGTRTGS